MLCLKQCIDLCDLTPQEAGFLAEYASLPQIVAAQAACPLQDGADAEVEDLRCALLQQLHAAESFADLHRVAYNYRAFALARAAAVA